MKQNTPWGFADHQKTIAPGIIEYSTPSHGGFSLSDERMAEMQRDNPDIAALKTWAGEGWYEEDCDWALVVLAFPQYFDDTQFHFACQTVRHDRAQLLTPERQARHAAWLAANADKYSSGCEGTADGGGWFVNAHCVADYSKTLSKVFAGVVVLPAVFTREQFENAPLFQPRYA